MRYKSERFSYTVVKYTYVHIITLTNVTVDKRVTRGHEHTPAAHLQNLPSSGTTALPPLNSSPRAPPPALVPNPPPAPIYFLSLET